MPKNQDQTVTLKLTPRTASAVLTALSVTVDKIVSDFRADLAGAPGFIIEAIVRPRAKSLLDPLQEVGETLRMAANETWADDADAANAAQIEDGMKYDKVLPEADDADAPDYDADEQAEGA